jgi:acyl-CoA thioester hydrolase
MSRRLIVRNLAFLMGAMMSDHVPSELSHGYVRDGRLYWPVRVYYEDTDFSGAVYHASYLRFMERGRTEFLRSYGIFQSALMSEAERDGVGFVVRHMEIDFRKPARMDDSLAVETVLSELGGASLDMEQRILRKDEILVAARVRIACVAQGRPQRLPPQIRFSLTK